MIVSIQSAVSGKYPRVFRIFMKLVHTKTQQNMDNPRELIGCTVFSQVLVLLAFTSTGVLSTFSYNLSSLCYIYPQFAPTYPLCLCLRQRQSMMPPWLGQVCKSIQLQYNYDDLPRHCKCLRQPPCLQRSIRNCALTPPTKTPTPPPMTSAIMLQASTVGGITNVFYFFLIPNANTNEWICPGIFLTPTSCGYQRQILNGTEHSSTQ